MLARAAGPRGASAIGVIAVARTQCGRSRDRQIALLETFADQAVIAIENVRLFTSCSSEPRATEALEQQTATSEILRVISRSQTDVQPVFDTIVQSAARLCERQFGVVCRSTASCCISCAHHGTTEASRRRSFASALSAAAPHRGPVAARAGRFTSRTSRRSRRHRWIASSRIAPWRQSGTASAARRADAPRGRRRSARSSSPRASPAVHRQADRACSRPSPTRR